MNITYSLLLSSIAGFSTVIGSLFVFLKPKNPDKFIVFCLAFSLSIMIGVSIFDLIPESLFPLYNSKGFISIIIFIILFIISFILIKFLNNKMDKYENNLYKLGIISMIVMILHNLPEGVLTFLSSYLNPKVGLKLSIAIALHNIPEGVCIAVPIYYATGKRSSGVVRTLLSGMVEPLGALLAYLFLFKYVTNDMIYIILLLVAGLMITLAIEKIYPETLKYHAKNYFILGVIVGLTIILINILL